MGMDNTTWRGVHRIRGGTAWDMMHQYMDYGRTDRGESQGQGEDSTRQESEQDKLKLLKK
jgi:hypothetical protein